MMENGRNGTVFLTGEDLAYGFSSFCFVSMLHTLYVNIYCEEIKTTF